MTEGHSNSLCCSLSLCASSSTFYIPSYIYMVLTSYIQVKDKDIKRKDKLLTMHDKDQDQGKVDGRLLGRLDDLLDRTPSRPRDAFEDELEMALQETHLKWPLVEANLQRRLPLITRESLVSF